MTAKGKITTANITRDSIIMVRRIESDPTKAMPSWTKVKDAVPLKVHSITAKAPTGRQRRRTYDIVGITPEGTVLTVKGSAPSQTYWLGGSA
jgi:hypothetical protein